MRAILLLLLLATAPGCLAAAAGGIAYVIGKGKEADAEKDKARLDYVRQRRTAGATDDQILAEIARFDPEWAEEIREGKSGLEVPIR
jgi:hypothetical protein